MATKVERSRDLAKNDRSPMLGKIRSGIKDSWLGRNWTTVLVLAAIILIALFVRSYFGYGSSGDNGFLVAGGSDSYYHERVIDYVQATGEHLVIDDLLNYPLGMRNARPPLYDWSVAVSGQVLSKVTGMSLDSATGYSLVWSTALWGALTVIPVYLITRKAFGNRAGLIAGLLFAIMPGHITRSVFADADHDAMVLFFAVTCFYFLMLALMSINGSKWVENWKDRKSVKSGLLSYARGNQRSLIFAAMGGLSLAAVGMMWTGYTYILIIVLVYFLVQLFINRFKNADSMGVWITTAVLLAVAFVVMAPLYWQMDYWGVWFDVPVYLFIGSMIVGGILVATRDYPWTMVLPVLFIFLAGALAVIAVFAPNIFEAIISGQGYLVKSKLYSTIAEAQAPVFSDLVMSFGLVSFWLAVVGVAWAAMKIPKNPSPYLVFIVVWMGVSMYMAASAARFMFNASPAFAMAAGWILALIVDRIHFEDFTKAFSGFRSNPLGVLRKAVKIRHVAAVFFLAFLIVLPNTMGAVDAGIPSELKRQYDKQVYSALPDFLQPANYDAQNGSYWFFGAFPYSMPLPTEYWPAAWDWFRTQDQGSAVADKPAFLSWWDYGFEAIQEGQHPTVADNFQNGYQFAGSFLMAQDESDAVSLFILRTLEKVGVKEGDPATQVLADHGVNTTALRDIMENPSKYIDVVKGSPEIYGPYDAELSAANAKYAAARVELSKAGLDELVVIYHELRDLTGIEIGYFAVDSRLFPFSATSNNIFYAPAKLSDHRIDPKSNAPVDFYQIYAIDQWGQAHEFRNVTSDMTIVDYRIVYKDMFYDSMLYRALMGYGPNDAGKTSQGIPGISGSLYNLPPMQGWNMSHFRAVYKTAYYNPYNNTNGLQNHSGDWRAISYEEALDLKDLISKGLDNGTVDFSASALMNGVVFLQYYDGAVIQGRAIGEDGTPFPNIWVTVYDEYGVPHQSVRTDANGNYSLLAPFGEVDVVFSAGKRDPVTLMATELERETFNITEDQAMRKVEYTFDLNVTLSASTVKGMVFWDLDGNGRYSVLKDEIISNATVIMENATGYRDETVSNAQGEFTLVGLPSMSVELYAAIDGHKAGLQTIELSPSGTLTKNVAIEPGSIGGNVTFASGNPAEGVDLRLQDLTAGTNKTITTDSNGHFLFDRLLPGDYLLTPSDVKFTVGDQNLNVTAGESIDLDLTLYPSVQVSGTVTLDGQPQANIPIGFFSYLREAYAQTDSSGSYVITMPVDDYTAYATVIKGNASYVAMANVPGGTETVDLDIVLDPGAVVTGYINGTSGPVADATAIFTAESGAHIKTPANAQGQYRVVLPTGTYTVYAWGAGRSYWDEKVISGSSSVDIALGDSGYIYGQVWTDKNGNGQRDSGEGLGGAPLRYTNGDRTVTLLSGGTGNFNTSLPKGRDYTLNVTMDGYFPFQGNYTALNNATAVYVEMVPMNVTYTGNVLYPPVTPASVEVKFVAVGGDGAINNTATSDGTGDFTVSLKPGKYKVIVDEEVVAGVDTSKYEHSSDLTVNVGGDPDPLQINLIERVKVTGTLYPVRGTTSIQFTGPENKTVSANTTFQTYLIPGEYNISANVQNNNIRYAYLGWADIQEGIGPLNLTTEVAYNLHGQLQGLDVTNVQVPMTFVRDGGGNYTINSAQSGSYQAYLPQDAYDIVVEYSTKAKLNGSYKYVVYNATQSIDEIVNTTYVNVPLDRDFDNVTIEGSISGASSSFTLNFVALDQTAMNTTVTASSGRYNNKIAPGTYSVYGTSGGNVFLGTIVVEPYKDNVRNLTLEPGYAVSGTTEFNGTGMPAELTFSSGTPVKVTSDVNGDYSIMLPDGHYTVSAIGYIEERPGVNVSYTATGELNVTGAAASLDLDLTRVEKGAVAVIWDSADKEEVEAGETVAYTITVMNTGNLPDTFNITTDSKWNVTFSPATVTLDWGESETVTVTIVTPENAMVSHSPIKVIAKGVETSATGQTNVDVDIVPFYGMNLTFGKSQTTDGKSYVYSAAVKNTGNAEDSYNVTLANLGDLMAAGWNVTLKSGTVYSTSEVSVTVPAGQTKYVDVFLNKTDATPDPDVKVDLVGNSTHVSPVALSFGLELPQLEVPDNGINVTGSNVSPTPPTLPLGTFVLLGLIAVVLGAIVMMRLNLGVFGRRRRR